MIDITVLFLDETFSSTAIGPMEGQLFERHTAKCLARQHVADGCACFGGRNANLPQESTVQLEG